MMTIKEISIFNDDERQALNSFCKGEESTIRLDEVRRRIDFARSMTAEDDQMFIDLLDGLAEKFTIVSEERWDGMRPYLPFPVLVSDDDDAYLDLEVGEAR